MITNNPLYFTLSDASFAPRTLAMLKSLRRFDNTSDITFVAVGDLPEKFFPAFEKINVSIKLLSDLLKPEVLSHIKQSRSYLSALWTYPAMILCEEIHKSSNYSDIVYLDADLYFYGDPVECWNEIPAGNISIVRHNFSERLSRSFPESGEFNVSWVSMPVNDVGRSCAMKWAEECFALCPDTPVKHLGRTVYGDQRYLDTWPELYGGLLTVFQNPGIGLAPWNYENYKIDFLGNWTINNQTLVFYHFSSHQFGFFLSRKMGRTYSKVAKIPKYLYLEYERELRLAVNDLGLVNWKSRYTPIWKRFTDYLDREIRLSA
jgi:hypothetical protein